MRGIVVSELWFPLLRTSEDFKSGIPIETVRKAQDWLAWADHVVILFPLWLGSMPGSRPEESQAQHSAIVWAEPRPSMLRRDRRNHESGRPGELAVEGAKTGITRALAGP